MKSAIVRKDRRLAAVTESAVVTSAAPLQVRSGDVEYDARRAASCLLAPDTGDEVAVAILDDGRAYVVAVLERQAPGIAISVEGDCSLRATGTLSMVADDSVRVVSGGDLDLVASAVSLHSATTRLVTGALEVVGRAAKGDFESVALTARSLDGFFDRVVQRAKQSLRIVEESDRLRAGRIDQVARETFTLHADDAVVTARQLVKVDGGQIQLG